jgi:hypothetical protein
LRIVSGGSTVLSVRHIDLRNWFKDHELECCPRCRRTTAVPTPSGGFRLCLECGLVTASGDRVGDLTKLAG